MYQGGTNPFIPHWGPSPKRDEFGMSYDYNAPLSEYGYERPAYYLLRRFHQTLLNYADQFCYGEIFTQEPRVKPQDDLLRACIRMGDTDGGVLFISHYGNEVPLSDREAMFEVKTASGTVHIPEVGKLKLTNGDFAILPFNWDLGKGLKLVSSSAQPSGKIVNGKETVHVCSSLRDQDAEFVFELPAGAKLTTNGKQDKRGKTTIVRVKPALDAIITIDVAGTRQTFVTIPQDAIYHSVEDVINGQKTYLISRQDIAVDGNTVRLAGKGMNNFTLLSYPPVKWNAASKGDTEIGIFGQIEVSVPDVKPPMTVQKISKKKVLIQCPESGFEGLNDIYANIKFSGLVCRIFDQNTGLLVGDQLNAPELDWNVGLKRFRKALAGNGILFYANPADGDSKKELSADGMTLDEKQMISGDSKIVDITFTPEYRLELTAEK